MGNNPAYVALVQGLNRYLYSTKKHKNDKL